MLKNKDLFNIDVLVLNNDNTKTLKEVKSGVIFESSSRDFKSDGLFSTDIFGPVGSKVRTTQPAYIDLVLPVLHPLVYETLISLSSKYSSIIEGKKYAVFDNNLKDFVITEDNKGNTGYEYFMQNVHKIHFEDNNSDQRRYKIELVHKYAKPEFMTTKWLVIPAGLRDYTEDENGVPSEDEINNLYRKLLGTANMLKNTNIANNLVLLDPIRVKLQKTVLEIFQYIKSLIDGKSKFIQSKFIKRSSKHGTRNVLTPIPQKITKLGSSDNISLNHTQVGLYQYVKAIAPITINKVQSMFIYKILNPESTTSYLIDPETLETKLVNVKPKKRDEWFTVEGMTNIMNKLGQSEIRLQPVKIDGYYLALIWDKGNEIEVVIDTNTLPDDIDKSKLRPITYLEMFYISVIDCVDKYPAFVTRYPVGAHGGIYPSKVYLKTSIEGRKVNIKFGTFEREVKEYPILNKPMVESISAHLNKLKRLVGDFDGDMVSFVVLYTEESIREINKLIDSKEFYITTTGELVDTNADDNLDIVVSVLTE